MKTCLHAISETSLASQSGFLPRSTFPYFTQHSVRVALADLRYSGRIVNLSSQADVRSSPDNCPSGLQSRYQEENR